MNGAHVPRLIAFALITRLQAHVETLSTQIGGRVAATGLQKAASYIAVFRE